MDEPKIKNERSAEMMKNTLLTLLLSMGLTAAFAHHSHKKAAKPHHSHHHGHHGYNNHVGHHYNTGCGNSSYVTNYGFNGHYASTYMTGYTYSQNSFDTYGNPVVVHTNYANTFPHAIGMAPQAFITLKDVMMHASFESDRLRIARQAIARNYITSRQVLELMGLFSFESTRLNLAKFAYGYTVDPENYFIVNNGFTFSSSVNALNDFLAVY